MKLWMMSIDSKVERGEIKSQYLEEVEKLVRPFAAKRIKWAVLGV